MKLNNSINNLKLILCTFFVFFLTFQLPFIAYAETLPDQTAADTSNTCSTKYSNFLSTGDLPTDDKVDSKFQPDPSNPNQEDTGGDVSYFSQIIDLNALKGDPANTGLITSIYDSRLYSQDVLDSLTSETYINQVIARYGENNVGHYQNDEDGVNVVVACSPEGNLIIDSGLFNPYFPLNVSGIDSLSSIQNSNPSIKFENPIDLYALIGEECPALAPDWQNSDNPCPSFDKSKDQFVNGKWDAPKADSRILKTLLYLVTPVAEGGAGREYIQVKRIVDYNKNDTLTPKATPNDSSSLNINLINKILGIEVAKAAETTDPNISNAANFDEGVPDDTATIEATPPATLPATSAESGVAPDKSKCYISLDDDPAHPSHISTCLEISAIDKVRVTTQVKKKHLTSTGVYYTYESPFPLKVGWQTDQGQASDPPPSFSNLSTLEMSNLSINQMVLNLLDQFGLGGDVNLDVSNTKINSFGDIGLLIGRSLLEQFLGAPTGSFEGWSLSSLLNSMGRAYLEQQLGFVPGALQDGNNYEDLVRGIGRNTAEYLLGFPKGSFKTTDGSSQQIMESIGRSYLENNVFKVSQGTLTPGTCDNPTLSTDAADDAIDPSTVTTPDCNFPINSLSDLLERLGEGGLEKALNLPKQSLRASTYDSFRKSSFKAGLIFEDPASEDANDMNDYVKSKLSLGFASTSATATTSLYGFGKSEFDNPVVDLQKGRNGMNLQHFKQLVGSKIIENSVGLFNPNGFSSDANGLVGGLNARIPHETKTFSYNGKNPTAARASQTIDENIVKEISDLLLNTNIVTGEYQEPQFDDNNQPKFDSSGKPITNTVKTPINSVISETGSFGSEDPEGLVTPDPEHFGTSVRNVLNDLNDPGINSRLSLIETKNNIDTDPTQSNIDLPASLVPQDNVYVPNMGTIFMGIPEYSKANDYYDLSLLLTKPNSEVDSGVIDRLNRLTAHPLVDSSTPDNISAFDSQYNGTNDPKLDNLGWQSLLSDLKARINCAITSGNYNLAPDKLSYICSPTATNNPKINNETSEKLQGVVKLLDAESQKIDSLVGTYINILDRGGSLQTVQAGSSSGQSGMASAIGLPGQIYGIDGNGRLDGSQVLSNDPIRALVSPNQAGCYSGTSFTPNSCNFASNNLANIRMIGVNYAAKLFTNSTLAQRQFTSQVQHDFQNPINQITNFAQAANSFLNMGVSSDVLSSKGFDTSDFARIFQLDLSNSVFDRIGKNEIYRVFWNTTGASSAIKNSQAYQALIKASQKASQTISFYTTRLTKIKNNISNSNPNVNDLTKIANDFQTLLPDAVNKITTLNSGIKNIDRAGSPQSAMQNGRTVEISNQSYAALLKDMKRVVKGQPANEKYGRDIQDAERLINENLHLLEEIAAGQALPIASGGGTGYGIATPQKAAGLANSCLSSGSILSTLMTSKLTSPSSLTKLSVNGNELINTFKNIGISVGSCMVDDALGLPSGSILSWYSIGKMAYDSLPTSPTESPSPSPTETATDVPNPDPVTPMPDSGYDDGEGTFTGENLPADYEINPFADEEYYASQDEANATDYPDEATLNSDQYLTSPTPTPKPAASILESAIKTTPRWLSNHWSMGNFEMAVGLANSRGSSILTNSDRLSKLTSAEALSLSQLGQEILTKTALVKLSSLIPGVAGLMGRNSITISDATSLLQGDVRPIISKLGGHQIDQMFGLPAGSGSDLIFPNCYDSNHRLAKCDPSTGYAGQDPNQVRTAIIARLGFRELGLNISTIPSGFDLFGSGSPLENWGNASITQMLGLRSNTFNGKLSDPNSIIITRNLGPNHSPAALDVALGLNQTPFQQAVINIKNQMSAILDRYYPDSSNTQSIKSHLDLMANLYWSRTSYKKLLDGSKNDESGYWDLYNQNDGAKNLIVADYTDLKAYLSNFLKYISAAKTASEDPLSSAAQSELCRAVLGNQSQYSGLYALSSEDLNSSCQSKTVPDDILGNMDAITNKFSQQYNQNIRDFKAQTEYVISQTGDGSESYSDSYRSFLSGEKDANDLNSQIGTMALARIGGDKAAELIDSQLNKYAPAWLRSLILGAYHDADTTQPDGFEYDTGVDGTDGTSMFSAENSCYTDPNNTKIGTTTGYTMGQLIVGMVAPVSPIDRDATMNPGYANISSHGDCPILKDNDGVTKVSTTSKYNLLTGAKYSKFRSAIFDQFLGKVFSAKLENKLNIQTGTFKSLIVHPENAQSILLSQGVMMAANQVFGIRPSDCGLRNVTPKYEGDGNVCSGSGNDVTNLKIALRDSILAGFYDPLTNSYTTDFSTYRSLEVLNQGLVTNLNALMNRPGSPFKGNITKADIDLFLQGDGRFFTYLGLQYAANVINDQILSNPKTRNDRRRSQFLINYNDVRAAAGLINLNSNEQAAIRSQAGLDYKMNAVCAVPGNYSLECAQYYTSHPRPDSIDLSALGGNGELQASSPSIDTEFANIMAESVKTDYDANQLLLEEKHKSDPTTDLDTFIPDAIASEVKNNPTFLNSVVDQRTTTDQTGLAAQIVSQKQDTAIQALKYKSLDAAAYLLDPNIPLNFSRRVLSGDLTQQLSAFGEYGLNYIINASPEFKAFCRTIGSEANCSGDMVHLATDIIKAINGTDGVTFASILTSNKALVNTLDGIFTKWVSKNFGGIFKNFPPGVLTGMLAWGANGFKLSDFASDTLSVNGTKFASPGNILIDYGIDLATHWSDKMFGFKPGTTAKLIQIGKAAYQLASVASGAARIAYEVTANAQLLTESGITAAQAGLEPVGDVAARADQLQGVDFAKYKDILITLALNFIVNDVFGEQLAKVDASIGLPPGTMAQVVVIGITGILMAVGVMAFNPATVGIAIAALLYSMLFGIVKIVTITKGSAEGEYPFYSYGMGTAKGVRKQGLTYPEYYPMPKGYQYSPDELLAAEFDPTNPVSYKEGLKAAARKKVLGLIYDLTQMPLKLAQKKYPGQTITSDMLLETYVPQIFSYGDDTYGPLLDDYIWGASLQNSPFDDPPGSGYGDAESRCSSIWLDTEKGNNMCARTAFYWLGIFPDSRVTDVVSISW